MKNALLALSLVVVASLLLASLASGQLLPPKNELASQHGNPPFQPDTTPPLIPAPPLPDVNVGNAALEPAGASTRAGTTKSLHNNGVRTMLLDGNFR